ncbi:MAG: hypothetical protein ACI32F_06255 [Allobaculum sp.]
MKLKDLKDYHAYYVMSVVFLVSCFIFKSMVFFPLGCCFVCIGVAKQLVDQGKLPGRKGNSSNSSDKSAK